MQRPSLAKGKRQKKNQTRGHFSKYEVYLTGLIFAPDLT